MKFGLFQIFAQGYALEISLTWISIFIFEAVIVEKYFFTEFVIETFHWNIFYNPILFPKFLKDRRNLWERTKIMPVFKQNIVSRADPFWAYFWIWFIQKESNKDQRDL